MNPGTLADKESEGEIMNWKPLSLMLSVAAATTLAGAGHARAAPTLANRIPVEAAEGVPNLWFVQLGSAPAAEGTDRQRLRSERDAFRSRARAEGVRFRERREFDTLWNGFSIEASTSDVRKIVRSIDGVTGVWPVVKVAAPPKGAPASPELFTAIQMTGADIAQNELGYTGKGIKVAVMDTGIDVDHKDLGGDGTARENSGLFPTNRVRYGWDFVGDDFNADDTSPTYDPVPKPDPSPDDCNGHGTHVAGIVGANGTVKGVAPEVTFGAYRVFGCDGSTSSDIMLAAMERAYADGMQVLNMSIGSPFQWPQYPTAEAASRMVRKGMVVVASIGNSGANGLYSAGAPGLGRDVIGVASFDNTDVYLPIATASGRDIGYVTMTFSPNPPTSGGGEVVDMGPACNGEPPTLPAVTGKIALAARGSCTFGEKAANAIKAGAIAVLISNNLPGVFNGTLGAPIGDGTIPVVGISLEDGNFLRAQAATVNLAWTGRQASFPSPTGGLISSFSSYGLSPDLTLKPDIAAPGGNIYSTFPLEQGGYATLGGTSMSSPHVAGAAALLLQSRRWTRASEVRTILQNSADPHPWFGNPTLGFLDNVHRQGAGMVDIDDAILATTLVEPGKISVGEGERGPRTERLAITNRGRSPVTYDLSFVNALSTGGVITPSFTTSDAKVTFSSASVTVYPGRRTTVLATITPATAPQYGQYGGYVVFTPRDGGQVYRVPFAGFVGDYQSIVALTPTENGFPWLAISYLGEFYGPVTSPDDWVYSMVGEDTPWFLVHFEHQVERFDATILDAKSGQPVHPVFNKAWDDEFLPRNSTSTSFFAFAWDGTRIHSRGNYRRCEGRDDHGQWKGKPCTGEDMTKPLPDGQYVIVLKALKANGDPRNPKHWESWTSPVVKIDRP